MSLGLLILHQLLTRSAMITPPTSLLDILLPPHNPWLNQLKPGKSELPKGIRIIRHAGEDEDRFDRNERLHLARRKLHDWRTE